MSSHHIIREKQEPALLILSLQDFNDDWLGQLLEWSPTLLVTADVAEDLQSLDIKVDIILGNEQISNQEHVRFVPIVNDDAFTTALDLLVSEDYPAVNIISQEFNHETFRPFLEKLDLVIYHQQQKIVAVRPGFSKWLPAGRTVCFMEHLPDLVYTNLAPMTENVYKTVQDGWFSVNFAGSYLFIAEEL